MSASVSGPTGGGADGRGAGTGGLRIGVVLLVMVAIAVMVISRSTPERRPFDLDSTAVDGFAAIRLLLEERGVETTQVRANDPAVAELDSGSVLVVPAPDLASEREVESFVAAAERGAMVVFGSQPGPDDSGGDDPEGFAGSSTPGRRQLADEPLSPDRPGFCDLAELEDLGAIDVAFGMETLSADAFSFLPADSVLGPEQACYGTPDSSWFRSTTLARPEPGQDRSQAAGRVVVMGSPYLWVNARLHPAKEAGGPVPDNAATAIRLLHRSADGRTSKVTVIEAVRTSPIPAGGSQNPVELLPFGVKLALVQLLAAAALFVWWRSRRLGAAMVEPLPVEIAGSELVSAVGRLRYRRSDTSRAARVLRADMRRRIGMSLGVPPTAPFEVFVEEIARRTGRPTSEVHQILAEGPIDDRNSLVRLSNDLESLRLESQDVHER